MNDSTDFRPDVRTWRGAVIVELESRAPHARCHECGSLSLAGLCHHCWRPLCSNHAHPAGQLRQWLVGREGWGTGLDRIRAQHCAACAAPAADAERVITIALAILAAVAALSLASIVSPAAAGAVAAVAVLVAGVVLVTIRRRARAAWRRRPMPLRPTVERLGLTERLNVTITLTESGDYVALPSGSNGKVEALLVFGRTDRERFNRWLRQGPPGAARDTHFTAGRLVLTGRAPMAAEDLVLGPVVPLDGRTAYFPVFGESDSVPASHWTLELPYRLPDDPDLRCGPIWITPSVLPGSDRRSLELELQWVKLGPYDQPLAMEMVDFFELVYPAGWGEVEQVSGGSATVRPAAADGKGRSLGNVRWTQILPRANEQEERRLKLGVQFKNKVDLNDQVSGSVEVVMKGALSGIGNIELYGSLGERRQQSDGARIRTRITARFDLSLASIRYQADRVFSPHHARDGEVGQRPDSFDVVPGDETIIELTNAMSEHGYYVKRVIENPPHSGNKADVFQRYWDIAGRHYHGVWPLDFHLIVTGEELHRGSIRPAHGKTTVHIIVRGTYSNKPGMEEHIEELWNELDELTRRTIQTRMAESSPASANGSATADGQATPGGQFRPVGTATSESVLRAYMRKRINSWISGRIIDDLFLETLRRAGEDRATPANPASDPDDPPDSDELADGSS
jgi:hypothetical protein